ncbi:hypothetical protein BH23BAC3_BH23BAC3_07520 [soil metagenome]
MKNLTHYTTNEIISDKTSASWGASSHNEIYMGQLQIQKRKKTHGGGDYEGRPLFIFDCCSQKMRVILRNFVSLMGID